ncbi:MAG: protein tyrosine phosphatase [Confluentimicrobium sp.]|nr:protein tyrosine phosphatase [Actibacterium sp.]
MFDALKARLKTLERKVRLSFGDDISTPAKRREAWFHFHLMDHHILRYLWTNFDKVADGVYRSNHPGHSRLKAFKEMGGKTVLNLRGQDRQSPWLFEEESCRQLGLNLTVAKIYARKPARKEEILKLIDAMKTAEKPMLMHCKSGADRAGFASVLYQVIVEGVPLEQARSHLGMKYLHLKWTQTGIVDHILDLYEARDAESPIGLEDWFRHEYDGREAARSFARLRGQPEPLSRRERRAQLGGDAIEDGAEDDFDDHPEDSSAATPETGATPADAPRSKGPQA